jgi:uncharacterized protein YbaP (TraB family)
MAGIWTHLRKGLGRALASLGLLSASACATIEANPRNRAEAPRPALWKLGDADTTIYLFGTIHLLPKDLNWRTPTLERALAASDELYLETTLGSDVMGSAQTMMRLGVSPGLPPIIERVPPERREEFRKMIASTGVPEKSLDRLETWAAALTLFSVSFRNMGVAPEAGVERGLSAIHAGANKPVKGLETIEQQFGYFDKLSEESQRALLLGMIDDPQKAKAEFQEMLAAWKSGDVDAIARTFDSETVLSPELRDVLMKRRNQAWAEWLARRLQQPGTLMVAVGAGHLAGPDSVQNMLQARGIKISRIQ